MGSREGAKSHYSITPSQFFAGPAMPAGWLLPRPGVQVAWHIVAVLWPCCRWELPLSALKPAFSGWTSARWGCWQRSAPGPWAAAVVVLEEGGDVPESVPVSCKVTHGFCNGALCLLVQEAVRRWWSYVSAGSLWLCVLKEADSKHRGHRHPADLNLQFAWAPFQKAFHLST